MLGAAGAVEAIITLLALRDGVAPPTLNLEEPLPLPLPDGREGAALLVGGVPQFLASDATAAMSNSFGFGGTNTSLLFSRFDGGDGQE
jgi:3-oxoacyl-[acyl-carrier-protein] synthase II